MSSPSTPLPDDNRRALRQVCRAARKAALSTLLASSGGQPYVSLVTVAFDHDLSPLFLLSGLADHTRNLDQDNRLSLLLEGTDGHPNPQTGPRVTLTGRAYRLTDDRLLARFLARHPGAALYAGFGDFGLWRVQAERAHFVGGFGRAVWFDHPFGLPDSTWLADAEAPGLKHINSPLPPQGPQAVGLDPDGVEMTDGTVFWRKNFHKTLTQALDLPPALAEAGPLTEI